MGAGFGPRKAVVLLAAVLLQSVAIGGSSAAAKPKDKTPPSAPTRLKASRVTQASLVLSWRSSKDNRRVVSYRLYRNGRAVGRSRKPFARFTRLRCGTRYRLGVVAVDAAGNRSKRASLRASTRACPLSLPPPPLPPPSPPPASPSAPLSPPPSLPLPPPAPGGPFYVAPSGSDANPGSQEAPWRTVQKAIDTLSAGQTALIRGGSYPPATCEGASDSGSAVGYVTLEAYSGEQPVLSSPNDYVLYLTDCDYVRVEGLKLMGPGGQGGTLVYGAGASDHVQLVGNEITGSRCQGIFTERTTSSYEILRNWIHDNGSGCDRQAHGIYLEGDDHVAANNVIDHHPQGFGIQHYPAGQNALISGNTITRSGHGGIVVGGSGVVSGAKVVNNIVANNGTYGIDRDSTAPTSCSIHHNLAFLNGFGDYDPNFACLGFNLSGNPLFVNLLAGLLGVLPGSPAIDAGDPTFSVSPAFDGTPRPQGAAPDIGAHER